LALALLTLSSTSLGFSVLQEHTEKEFIMNKITVCISCAIDEGRPLGIGFQEQISNHSKLLW
jgi:hypothetical protein